MNLNMKQIGSFIQGCRKEAGITQSEMGERLGVSAQSVSNWERGESLPDVSLLPDIACMLNCSVDTLLSGGCGGGGFRRHVTVVQMQEALSCVDRIGELLGRDHFIYQCIVEALNARMNTNVEEAFSDTHIFDVFTIEFLLGCIGNGDYADPADVTSHLPSSRARDYILNTLKEKGVR